MAETPASRGAPKSAAPRALERGETVGRFVLLNLVGRGGMGEVYAAYDPELDRKVAVKLLRARSTEGEARLLREAQAIAKLQHPNVIVVFDVGKFHDTVFIAMEFIDGNTLGYWTQVEKRPWRETLRLYEAAGRGLAAAHEVGLIHRDFKPDNVMLTKDGGQVRVMDFGLARQIGEGEGGSKSERALTVSQVRAQARAAGADEDLLKTRPLGPPTDSGAADLSSSSNVFGMKLTQTGAQVGTPAYMAPEQFATGRTVDARTDQFSFCVALYEALYGQRPFAGQTLAGLTASVLQGEVRPPPEKTQVPSWVGRVLLRGLSTKPAERFPTMTALLVALADDPAVRRRRWLTIGAVAGAAAALALGANRLGAGTRTMCTDGAARFASAWEGAGDGGGRRASIQAAFARTGKAFAGQAFVATARLLDEYAARWSTMYRDACEATNVRGDQSAAVLDLRMTCLGDRLGNVRALTDVLAKADDGVVQNAVSAAGALPHLDGCADIAVLRAVIKPPEDPATRKRVAELREELAHVTALRDSGQCGAAESRGVPLISAVRATGYSPLLAETLSVLGALGGYCGEPSVAILRLKEAYRASITGRNDLLAAEAAASIATISANHHGHVAEARDWAGVARATIGRLGGNERIDGYVLVAEGRVAASEHDREQWVAKMQAAQTVTRKVFGAEHPLAIGGLINFGDALAGAGRLIEALEADREAHAVAARVLGPDHPLVGNILNNECEALNRLGRFAESLEACRRALAIFQVSGAGAVIESYALAGIGLSLIGAGHADEAVAPLEEAVAVRERAHLAAELLGEVRFALARSLWPRSVNRARALGLARQARADLTADAGMVAAVDRWLADPTAAVDLAQAITASERE